MRRKKLVEQFIFHHGVADRFCGTAVRLPTDRVAALEWERDVLHNYKSLPPIAPEDRTYLHLANRRWLQGDASLAENLADHDCLVVCSTRESPHIADVVREIEAIFGAILHLSVVFAPEVGHSFRFSYCIGSNSPLYSLARDPESFLYDDKEPFSRRLWRLSEKAKAFILRDRRWIHEMGNFAGPSLFAFGLQDGDLIVVVPASDGRSDEDVIRLLEADLNECCNVQCGTPRCAGPGFPATPKMDAREADQGRESIREKPTPLAEAAAPVLLGAATPRQIEPGDEFVVRFAAYTGEYRTHVAALFKQESPQSELLLDLHACEWQIGTVVTTSLSSRHLSVENPVQSFAWDGRWRVIHYDVSAPPHCRPGTVILRLDIAVEGVPIVTLRPEIEVVAGRRPRREWTEFEGRLPRTAFASYASPDRRTVLGRVRSLQICTGIEVFVDCLSIRPGEQWKPAIREEISRRDAFWLFWSSNARASKWVDWEWRAALEARKEIQPHPLEPSDIAPPPPELNDVQFGAAFEMLLVARQSNWITRTARRCVAWFGTLPLIRRS